MGVINRFTTYELINELDIEGNNSYTSNKSETLFAILLFCETNANEVDPEQLYEKGTLRYY